MKIENIDSFKNLNTQLEAVTFDIERLSDKDQIEFSYTHCSTNWRSKSFKMPYFPKSPVIAVILAALKDEKERIIKEIEKL